MEFILKVRKRGIQGEREQTHRSTTKTLCLIVSPRKAVQRVQHTSTHRPVLVHYRRAVPGDGEHLEDVFASPSVPNDIQV
jgi:hypothetical protein